MDIKSDVEVKLIRCMGDDNSIVQAARVSVQGENSPEITDKNQGLINYLMRKKHGSPFEHNALTFYVKAPIFVFREFHRHRVGFSYNEMSGRYTVMQPEFYAPDEGRKLINTGTSANPTFAPGNDIQVRELRKSLEEAYEMAWQKYDYLLSLGIANEVARMCLPVGIMSQMYVTCNTRSLMHFLSLRTSHENARYISNPQHEIEMVANKMEAIFQTQFPWVWNAYETNGRVAP